MTQRSLPARSSSTRAARRLADHRQARRSAVLTLASTVVPGAGLFGTRRRLLGAALLGAFVVALALLAGYVLQHHGPVSAALALTASSRALLVVALGTAVAALLWAAGIVVTHLVSRPRHGPHRLLAATTAVLVVLVLLPFAQVVRCAWITRDTIGGVFGGSLVQAGPSGSPTTEPAADPWADKDRVNVFLLGSDAGPDRTGVRTDSMIVASINTHTGDAVLVGIPRNLENAPIPADNPLHTVWPNGYNCGDPCLINALWTEAENHRSLFGDDPNPGLTTIRQVLEEVTGLPIDYTVIADLKGFQQLVDAIGGVRMNVQQDTPIYGPPPAYTVQSWITKGVQVLDGYHALWYARSRHYSDDYSRMKRQRCVVAGIVQQLDPLTILTRYPQIAAAVKDNVQTDLPQAQLPAWAQLLGRVQGASITSVTLTPQTISVVHPDYAKIKALVAQATAVTSTTPTGATASGAAGSATPGAATASGGSTPSTRATNPSATPDIADLAQAC